MAASTSGVSFAGSAEKRGMVTCRTFSSVMPRRSRLTAGLLAAKLREGGHEVFWDRRMEAGAEWNEEIQAALRRARCVLVLWSAASEEILLGTG